MGFLKNMQDPKDPMNLERIKNLATNLLKNGELRQVPRVEGFGPREHQFLSYHLLLDNEQYGVTALFDYSTGTGKDGYVVRMTGVGMGDDTQEGNYREASADDTEDLDRSLSSIFDAYEALVKFLIAEQKREHRTEVGDDYVFDIVDRLEFATRLDGNGNIQEMDTGTEEAVGDDTTGRTGELPREGEFDPGVTVPSASQDVGQTEVVETTTVFSTDPNVRTESAEGNPLVDDDADQTTGHREDSFARQS